MATELEEYERVFELRRQADQRAIKIWREAHPGREHVFPDHTDLLLYLMVDRERLYSWVNDLQSGMYINCVYCGHRYGPKDDVPASMADVLKRHVEKCEKHPMSALKSQLHEMTKDRDHWKQARESAMAAGEVLKAENERLKKIIESRPDAYKGAP
jgi:hypothetical protein